MLKPFKTALIATLFSLSLSTTAVANSDDLTLKGLKAYEKGDYKTALKYYQKAADQGNIYAKGFLGYLYFNGQGVNQNISKGAKMIQNVCNLGVTEMCDGIQEMKNICATGKGKRIVCEQAGYPYFE